MDAVRKDPMQTALTTALEDKRVAYYDRNLCIALLGPLVVQQGGKAWLGRDQVLLNDPLWSNVAFIELPDGGGQLSWHVHVDDLGLFRGWARDRDNALPWDGHSSEEKHERLKRYLDKLAKGAGCAASTTSFSSDSSD
jgi:hypothetical protein